MDLDSSQNWLAFSVSNPSCLLDHFSSSPHHTHGEEAKLEDFLGGFSGDASGLKTIAAGMLRPDGGGPAAVPGAPSATPQESRRTVDTFGQRTSIYRGVTRHRWTGRYEAHLWDNSCRREGQSRKGRQVYLGGYDKEEKAARAYDLAALKYWGPTTTTNFPVSNYEKELEEMKNMTRQEFVASLRRKSSGFSRGASIYRGVTRHHQHGRWQARIGRVAGNKDLYLGTFSTQEEAAEAYDIAAIKFRGLNAVTNFDMSRYDIKSIINSNLPIGGMSGRATKASESSSSSSDTIGIDAKHQMDCHDAASSLGFSALPLKPDQDYWSLLALQHQQQQQQSNASSAFGVFYNGINMDFSAASSHNVMAQPGITGGLVWNNGIIHHQQEQEQQQHEQAQSTQTSSCSSIPYATPIPFGGAYEGSSSFVGGWVAPSSSYYHQTSKANMTRFQTPIYGME